MENKLIPYSNVLFTKITSDAFGSNVSLLFPTYSILKYYSIIFSQAPKRLNLSYILADVAPMSGNSSRERRVLGEYALCLPWLVIKTDQDTIQNKYLHTQALYA